VLVLGLFFVFMLMSVENALENSILYRQGPGPRDPMNTSKALSEKGLGEKDSQTERSPTNWTTENGFCEGQKRTHSKSLELSP
jgi:hypothetical protein